MLYDNRKDESVGEIVKGLICYFDKALPAMLLYKSERQQYEELMINDVSPSSIYGAEHLLRLFGNTDCFLVLTNGQVREWPFWKWYALFSFIAVRLPELLSQANIEEETLMELQQKLVDLLKYLFLFLPLFLWDIYRGFPCWKFERNVGWRVLFWCVCFVAGF